MKFSVKLEDIIKNPTIHKDNDRIIKIGYKKINRKKSGVKEYITIEISEDVENILEISDNHIVAQKNKQLNFFKKLCLFFKRT